ncbi:hypothetical protein D3C76_1830090 [compost metagenome]
MHYLESGQFKVKNFTTENHKKAPRMKLSGRNFTKMSQVLVRILDYPSGPSCSERAIHGRDPGAEEYAYPFS